MPKPRFFEGTSLPANLYPDQHGDRNVWRYRRPNGSYARLKMPLHAAIEKAKRANAQTKEIRARKSHAGASRYLAYWVEQHIDETEVKYPKRYATDRFRFNCYYLRAMAKELNYLTMDALDEMAMETWWDGLTYNQQSYMRAELSRLFALCKRRKVIREGQVPFGKGFGLMCREKCEKARLPIKLHEFWHLYNLAIERDEYFLATAMKLSFATTMREGDILELMFSRHLCTRTLEDGSEVEVLRKVINKAANSRNDEYEARIEFTVTGNRMLEEAIAECRENAARVFDCTHLIARRPERRRMSDRHRFPAHWGKVSASLFQEKFRNLAQDSKLWEKIPADRTRPTFHEIRGLAITEMAKTNNVFDVQRLAAHSHPSQTKKYMREQEKPWLNTGVLLDYDQVTQDCSAAN